MRIATRLAGVVLAAGALGGLGSLAGTAYAATPGQTHATAAASQDSAQVGAPMYSRGFHIYNLTTSPMALKSVTGDGNFEGKPDVGSVVQPGQYADFEVQYRAFSVQNDDVTYSNADGSFTAHLKVDGVNYAGNPSSTCTVNGGADVCSDPDDGVNTNGTTIAYEMPAGTTITYNGDQAQQQADVLKQLCDSGANATCSFTPTSETHVAGPSHMLAFEYNNSDGTATLEVDKTDDVSSTDSLNISATLGTNIAGMVDASVTAAYGHTWSEGHGFAAKSSDPVDPHTYGEIDGIAPMIRDTGNFTLTMGNTTYHLNGVYFDSPDPQGGEGFEYHTHKLTQAQIDSLPRTAAVTQV